MVDTGLPIYTDEGSGPVYVGRLRYADADLGLPRSTEGSSDGLTSPNSGQVGLFF